MIFWLCWAKAYPPSASIPRHPLISKDRQHTIDIELVGNKSFVSGVYGILK